MIIDVMENKQSRYFGTEDGRRPTDNNRIGDQYKKIVVFFIFYERAVYELFM